MSRVVDFVDSPCVFRTNFSKGRMNSYVCQVPKVRFEQRRFLSLNQGVRHGFATSELVECECFALVFFLRHSCVVISLIRLDYRCGLVRRVRFRHLLGCDAPSKITTNRLPVTIVERA